MLSNRGIAHEALPLLCFSAVAEELGELLLPSWPWRYHGKALKVPWNARWAIALLVAAGRLTLIKTGSGFVSPAAMIRDHDSSVLFPCVRDMRHCDYYHAFDLRDSKLIGKKKVFIGFP